MASIVRVSGIDPYYLHIAQMAGSIFIIIFCNIERKFACERFIFYASSFVHLSDPRIDLHPNRMYEYFPTA